jgi:hypothetical protein
MVIDDYDECVVTASSTLSEAARSSIVSYTRQVPVPYGLAGNIRRISGMCRNWLMSSRDSIRGILDNDWSGGMGLDVVHGFYFAYLLINLGLVQMASALVFTTSGDQSSGGRVSQCTEFAVRLL